ncbi:MAG: hypothetical protein R3E02_13770 [Blastomonas sp.]
MDSLRGLRDSGDQGQDYGHDDADLDDDAVMDARHSFGTDERRMHVRAYNYWAKLLGERCFPSIEDLDPANIEDFGPHSVLLDFTLGLENPAVSYVGQALRDECGLDGEISRLDDVPARSLLTRITDHFMQIIANKAPIGFEAEFVNQRNVTIMYRGILLPFSSDDDTIDFIYGVINWKEMADKATTDELIEEIDRVVKTAPRKPVNPIWDDGPDDDLSPGSLGGNPFSHSLPGEYRDDPMPLGGFEIGAIASATDNGYIEILDLDPGSVVEETDFASEPVEPAADASLADWLLHAREWAEIAHASEDRSRGALYRAIGRAYDFALVARDNPDDFAELIEDAGISVQERAPMTPVVKLVFGAGYDKTRLAEYASALGHAMRVQLPRGTLADYLQDHEGGLKGLVRAERALRNADKPKAKTRKSMDEVSSALRQRAEQPLDSIAGASEFTVLLARRGEDGRIAIVGALENDDRLTDQVLRKIAD